MAAGLVGEEGEQVVGDGAQFVLVREHDDRRRADEAAVGLQGVEVERQVGERGGQDAARGAAGQVGEQAVARLQAAAVLVHQLAQADAGGGEVHAGLDVPAAATLFIGTVQGLVMQSLITGDMQRMRSDAPRVFAIYQRGIAPASESRR